MKMSWNVWRHDHNKRKIISWNIFEHYNFYKDVIRDLRDFDNKEEFARALNSNLLYYFWCKSEYEIILGPWNGVADERKIDIYQQIMLNKELFLDYVWSFKENSHWVWVFNRPYNSPNYPNGAFETGWECSRCGTGAAIGIHTEKISAECEESYKDMNDERTKYCGNCGSLMMKGDHYE